MFDDDEPATFESPAAEVTLMTPLGSGPSRAEESVINAAGQIAAAQCRWLLELAELDSTGEVRGFYSPAAWLSWRCSLHIRTATEYVKVAHALKKLPRITRDFSCGRLSCSQVKMHTGVATPATEEVLLHIALSSTVGQLAKVVGTYRSFLEAEADERARHRGRSVSTWFDEDGFFVIRGRLCADEGAVVDTALRRAMESKPAPPRPQTSSEQPPGEVLDHYGARQADALAQVARVFLSAERQDQRTATLPEVVVHVDLEKLTGGEGEECHLENGVALAPSTALRLSCDAALVPLIQDGAGNPLSVGRRTRAIPVGMRRALKDRDKGCRFPGCARNRYLQGHHIHHWSRGGQTCISNLIYLCHLHHRLVHEGSFSVAGVGDDFEFRRPGGSAVEANPLSGSRHTGTVWSENGRRGVVVEPEAICSGWDGERMNLGYVMESICDARSHDPPNLE